MVAQDGCPLCRIPAELGIAICKLAFALHSTELNGRLPRSNGLLQTCEQIYLACKGLYDTAGPQTPGYWSRHIEVTERINIQDLQQNMSDWCLERAARIEIISGSFWCELY